MERRLIPPLLLIIGLVLAGCKSEPEQPKKPEATIENLKVAHAAAYHRAAYYAAEADQAETERLGNLAAMFRAIARSEEIHAAGHAALLKLHNEATDTSRSPSLPLGSVRQALKMGASLESTEANALYPPMIRAATSEQWPEAADQFAQFRDADTRQGELIANAQQRRGILSIASYCICLGCGYIQIDQDEDLECPVCRKNGWERI